MTNFFNMTGFYLSDISELIVQILGIIFAIRICFFKKDAWIFFFLASIFGSLSIYIFFVIHDDLDFWGYFMSLASYDLPRLFIAIVAIFFLREKTIFPKRLAGKQLPIILLTTVLIALYLYITKYIYFTLPLSSYLDFGFYIFGVLTILATILLILGYIEGLLIYASQFFYGSLIDISSSHYNIYLLFSITCFIVYSIGYIRNRRLL